MRFLLCLCCIFFNGSALADFMYLECKIKQHIVLQEHELSNGMMGTFTFKETSKRIAFSKGGYFDGETFDIEFSTPDYLKATGDYNQTFIYRSGHFHFSFISYYHVTSMSGECRHIPLVIEG